jgi:RNA polymerase sigma-70 factor (ECF subfamily)
MGKLCGAYYEPVLAFLRRDGRNADAAREVAHEFFEGLLAGNPFAHLDRGHGKFRSYLLGALKHFLSHRREHAARQRRGGGAEHVPIVEGTDTSPGLVLADESALPPDACFDQRWAIALLDHALSALETECAENARGNQFEKLKPWLTGETTHGDQAALANSLGLTESALKSAVHRLRRRFRQLVKLEVARTLTDSAEVDAEMAELFRALSGA